MTTDGRSAVLAEIEALTDALGSTLGPYGARKLVVEGSGTVTVTSSCAAILDRLDVDNPAVTVFDEAASGFTRAHGDGAGRLVTLTGALLHAAGKLSDQGVGATSIERGYREASSVAVDRLAELERPVSDFGVGAVAHTALTDVRDQAARRHFGSFVGEIVDDVRAPDGTIDAGDVAVVTRIGAGQAESALVHGAVLDRPPVVPEMPRAPGTVGVALCSETVDVPKLGGATARTDRRYSLETASLGAKRSFAERERAAFREQLDAVLEAGCRVVATRKAINERVERVLANRGVLALQRVEDDDFDRLARATGAEVVPGLGDVTAGVLGRGTVRVRREAGRDMTVVESTGSEPVYTLFCRSPDQRSLESLRRSMEAAIASVDSALEGGTVVPGGGATEVAAARAVTRHARSVGSVEQLAMEAYGRALTAIPRTLAGTAGMDGTDAVVALRTAHNEGRDAVGIDCLLGRTTDVTAVDGGPIVDPAALARDLWSAATDLAVHFVRIDGRIPATDLGDGSDGSDGPDVASRT